MRAKKLLLILAIALASGCAPVAPVARPADSTGPFQGYAYDAQFLDRKYSRQCERPAVDQLIDTSQAIELARKGPDFCQPGTFKMVVLSTGRSASGVLFLNSTPSYRENPNNLSVSISPQIEDALKAAFGGPIERVALKHVISVNGVARRIRIDYLDPSGRFYYQTHVPVVDPQQIEMLGTIERGSFVPVTK